MKYVKHLKKDEWGIGKVLSRDESKIKVDFLNEGVKLLSIKLASLSEVINDNDIMVYQRTKESSPKKEKQTTLDLEKILEQLNTIDIDKEYNIYIENKKISKLQNTKEPLKELKRAISKNKYIHSLEKTNFRKAFKSQDEKLQLLNELSIISQEEFIDEGLFKKINTLFIEKQISKWTILTYFLNDKNLSNPLIRPKPLKKLTSTLGYDIAYSSIPNWLTYLKVRDFYTYLKEKLSTKEIFSKYEVDDFFIEFFIDTSIKNI